MSDEIGNTAEEWRTIAEFPSYSVSNLGRVRRDVPGGFSTFVGLLSPQVTQTGYVIYYLKYNGTRKTCLASRLVAKAFLAPDPDPARNEVNHKSGVKADNRPCNLEWATRSENNQHAYSVLGKKAVHGDSHFYAKLTVAKVQAIRRLLAEGTPRSALALYFEVSKDTIRSIQNGKNWRHVA